MTFNEFKSKMSDCGYSASIDDFSRVAVKKDMSRTYDVEIYHTDKNGKIYGKPIADVRGDLIGFSIFGKLPDKVLLIISHFSRTPLDKRFEKGA